MIIHNIEQRSEAWYECRLGRITGTRFATLVSGESTKGYQDLILDVAGEIITREVEETYTNDIMQQGIDLEGDARREFTDITNFIVWDTGFVTPDEDNEFHDWIGVSPDGIIWEDNNLYGGGLEIKCPLRKTHLRYMSENRLPNEYKWQVQGSLFVTGLPRWYFMSYYPEMKPFIIEVLPDKKMFSQIEERLRVTIPLIERQLETYKQYNYND